MSFFTFINTKYGQIGGDGVSTRVKERVYYGPYAPSGCDSGTRSILNFPDLSLQVGTAYGIHITGGNWFKISAGLFSNSQENPNFNITNKLISQINNVGWAISPTRIETVPFSIENVVEPSEGTLNQPTIGNQSLTQNPIQPTSYSYIFTKNIPEDIFSRGDPVYLPEGERISTQLVSKTGANVELIGFAEPSSETDLTVKIWTSNYFPGLQIPRNFNVNMGGNAIIPEKSTFLGNPARLDYLKLLFDGKDYEIVQATNYNSHFCQLWKYNPGDTTELYKSDDQPENNKIRMIVGVAIKVTVEGNSRYALFSNKQISNNKQFLQTQFITKTRVVALPPLGAWDHSLLEKIPGTETVNMSADIPDALGWYTKVTVKRDKLTQIINNEGPPPTTSTFLYAREHVYLFVQPQIICAGKDPSTFSLQDGGSNYPIAWPLSSMVPPITELPPPSDCALIAITQKIGCVAQNNSVARTPPISGGLNELVELNRPIYSRMKKSLGAFYSTSSQTNHRSGGYRSTFVVNASNFSDFNNSNLNFSGEHLYNFSDCENLQVLGTGLLDDGIRGWIQALYEHNSQGFVTHGLKGTRKELTYVSNNLFDVPEWTTDDMPLLARSEGAINTKHPSICIYLFSMRTAKLFFDVPESHFSLTQNLSFTSGYYAGRKKFSDSEPMPLPYLMTDHRGLSYESGGGGQENIEGDVTISSSSISPTIWRLSLNITTKVHDLVVPIGGEGEYIQFQPAIYVICLENNINMANDFTGTQRYYDPLFYQTFDVGYSPVGVVTRDFSKGFSYLVWIPQLDKKEYITFPIDAPVLTNPSGTQVVWQAIPAAISYKIKRDGVLKYEGNLLEFTEPLTTGTYTYTAQSIGSFLPSNLSAPLIVVVA